MKLSDMTGHVLTIGLTGMIACSHAQPAPDASAMQDETKQEAQPQAKPTPEEYHAQGQADLDKALEQLRGVSVFFEFDSATLTKDAQEKLSNVANVLSAQGPHRGKLRRARLGPVQPCPGPAAGGFGEEVSCHPRSGLRPDHRHQLRRREAKGARPRRRGLAAEPARRPHREALRTCTIFAWSEGGAATISPPASRCGEPSKRVTRPPASSTSS